MKNVLNFHLFIHYFRNLVSNSEVCYHPVILTGDFNSDPHTYVYNLLVNGWLEVQGPSILPSSLGIMDTCQHVDVAKNRPFIRNETSDFKYVKVGDSV